MKQILTILITLCAFSATAQSLSNPSQLGQTTRNQKVGNGFQVDDTTLLKGLVRLSGIAGSGTSLAVNDSGYVSRAAAVSGIDTAYFEFEGYEAIIVSGADTFRVPVDVITKYEQGLYVGLADSGDTLSGFIEEHEDGHLVFNGIGGHSVLTQVSNPDGHLSFLGIDTIRGTLNHQNPDETELYYYVSDDGTSNGAKIDDTTRNNITTTLAYLSMESFRGTSGEAWTDHAVILIDTLDKRIQIYSEQTDTFSLIDMTRNYLTIGTDKDGANSEIEFMGEKVTIKGDSIMMPDLQGVGNNVCVDGNGFAYLSTGSAVGDTGDIQLSDGMGGLIYVDPNDGYGIARYEGLGAYTLGNRSGDIGDGSFAIGALAVILEASGSQSIAISPTFGQATGAESIVLGNGTAQGYNSVVIGSGDAVGEFGIAINGTANGDFSIALGGMTGGDFSTTLTPRTQTTASYEVAMGYYNTIETPVDDTLFNINNRAFSIGNDSTEIGSNSFTHYFNGNTGIGIGTNVPTCNMDIGGDKIRIRTSKTPSSKTDTGNAGDIAWDSNYIYICVATNQWKRVAITDSGW